MKWTAKSLFVVCFIYSSDFDQEEYTSLELPVQSVSPSMIQCGKPDKGGKNKAQEKENKKGKQPVPKKPLPPIPTPGNFYIYCLVVSFVLPEHLSSPPVLVGFVLLDL